MPKLAYITAFFMAFLAAFFLLPERKNDTQSIAPLATSQLIQRRERPLEALPDSWNSRLSRETLQPSDFAAETEPVDESLNGEPSGYQAWGQIIARSTGAPVEGATVRIKTLSSRGQYNIESKSDSTGRFSTLVPDEYATQGELVRYEVKLPNIIPPVQIRYAELITGIVLEIPEPTYLSGTLRSSSSTSFNGASVRIDALVDKENIQFVGRCESDADGKFGLTAYVQPWMDTAKVTIWQDSTYADSITTTFSELAKIGGVSLSSSIARTTIQVNDSNGDGIEDASVAVGASDGSEFWSEILTTSSTGNAAITCKMAKLRAFISAPGYSPTLCSLVWSEENTVTLESRTTESLPEVGAIFGLVSDIDGNPIPNATINAIFDSGNPELDFEIAHIQTTSDSNGAFRTPLSIKGMYRIGSYTKEHGESPYQTVRHDHTGEIRITVDRRYSRTVTLGGESFYSPDFRGRMRVLVIDRINDYRYEGYYRTSPYVISGLLEGEYTLIAYDEDSSLFGATEFSVEHPDELGAEEMLHIDLRIPQHSRGVVFGKSGKIAVNCKVRIPPSGAFSEMPTSWVYRLTDENGSYSVPLFTEPNSGGNNPPEYWCNETANWTKLLPGETSSYFIASDWE